MGLGCCLTCFHLAGWVGDHQVVHHGVGANLADESLDVPRRAWGLVVDRLICAEHCAGLDLSDGESAHVWRYLLLDEPAVLVTGRVALFLSELDMVHELARQSQERRVGGEVPDLTERRILLLYRGHQRPTCCRVGAGTHAELAVAAVEAPEAQRAAHPTVR